MVITVRRLYTVASLCITALILLFVYAWYDPFMPSLIHESSGSDVKLSIFMVFVQYIGSAFFLLYGKAAYFVPMVCFGIAGSLAHEHENSYSLLCRISGLLGLLFSIAAYYEYARIKLPEGIPASGFVGSFLYKLYISSAGDYSFYILCFMAFVFSLCVLQREGLILIKKTTVYIWYNVGFQRISSYILYTLKSWLVFFLPFLKKYISLGGHDVSELADSVVEEDLQDLESFVGVRSCLQKDQSTEEKNTQKFCVVERDSDHKYYTYKRPYELIDDNQEGTSSKYSLDGSVEDLSSTIISAFSNFGVSVEIDSFTVGPVVTTYKVHVPFNVRVQKVFALEQDIARYIGRQGIRFIEDAFAGSCVLLEVANEERGTVNFISVAVKAHNEILEKKVPLILGVQTDGNPYLIDLAKLPHVLIAGTTGSGKSVTMHTCIMSILWKFHHEECKLLLIDPKRLEFLIYSELKHLYCPVVNEIEEGVERLNECVEIMNARYQVLAESGVRTIDEYHQLDENNIRKMPYFIIIIDEFADIKMSSPDAEKKVVRICQMARAAGMHVILCTQRPSVDVIGGIVKANIPARICCKVSSKTDSKVVIDMYGAERLLGKGDMLVLPADGSVTRVHGSYVSNEDIIFILDVIKMQKRSQYGTIEVDFLDDKNSII